MRIALAYINSKFDHIYLGLKFYQICTLLTKNNCSLAAKQIENRRKFEFGQEYALSHTSIGKRHKQFIQRQIFNLQHALKYYNMN